MKPLLLLSSLFLVTSSFLSAAIPDKVLDSLEYRVYHSITFSGKAASKDAPIYYVDLDDKKHYISSSGFIPNNVKAVFFPEDSLFLLQSGTKMYKYRVVEDTWLSSMLPNAFDKQEAHFVLIDSYTTNIKKGGISKILNAAERSATISGPAGTDSN